MISSVVILMMPLLAIFALTLHMVLWFDNTDQQESFAYLIQTSKLITLDQEKYVFDTIAHYFGTNIDRNKTVTMWLHADSNFEKEDLAKLTPLPPASLWEYSIQYKGHEYCSHIGKLQHATSYTKLGI